MKRVFVSLTGRSLSGLHSIGMLIRGEDGWTDERLQIWWFSVQAQLRIGGTGGCIEQRPGSGEVGRDRGVPQKPENVSF